MRTALRALGAGALLVPGLTAGLAAAAPGLTLSACELEHPLRLTAVPAWPPPMTMTSWVGANRCWLTT